MSSSTGLILVDLKDFATNPISFMMKEYVNYKSKIKEGFSDSTNQSIYSMSNLIDFCVIVFRVFFIFIFGMFGIYYSRKRIPNQSRLTQTILAIISFGMGWMVVS